MPRVRRGWMPFCSRTTMVSMMVFALVMLSAPRLRAQLSPGALAQPHASLEGLTNCTQCHELSKGPSKDKCLVCHQNVNQRLKNGKGYHAQVDKPCMECHSEHAGRDFELVHWPEGMDQFNHTLTGHILMGRHAELKCRTCHKPELIVTDLKSSEPDINLERTLLGLPTACLGCHTDEHRQQLRPECKTCHSETAWKPAPGFNHDSAAYHLTGKHVSVPCASCHPTVHEPAAADTSYTKFKGLKFNLCTDCHKDPHKDRFGQDCARCHNTGSWRQVKEGQINHDSTDFPLRGLHVKVECNKCHTSGDPLKAVAHLKCTDCHKDTHRGQFTSRPDSGACESCHNVKGFRPALFTLVDHSLSDFRLEGAHLAQPCMACHKSTLTDDRGSYVNYLFEDRSCTGCHKDIHGGQFITTEPVYDCTQCHTVEQWAIASFDHNSRTTYKLEGAHKIVTCDKCHKSEQQADTRMVTYRATPPRCEDCHGGKRPPGDVGQDG